MPETSVVERKKRQQIRLSEIRSEVGFHDLPLAGKAVPRADREAVVATENTVTNGRSEFDRNGALEFNREVGNAPTRIQLKGRSDGLRRARSEAAHAGTATIFFRGVWSQFKRSDDFREEEPVAHPPADQIGVLADKSQAGSLRQVPLQERSRVHVPQ